MKNKPNGGTLLEYHRPFVEHHTSERTYHHEIILDPQMSCYLVNKLFMIEHIKLNHTFSMHTLSTELIPYTFGSVARKIMVGIRLKRLY